MLTHSSFTLRTVSITAWTTLGARLTPHVHVLVPEVGWDAEANFIPLLPPSAEDMEAVLRRPAPTRSYRRRARTIHADPCGQVCVSMGATGKYFPEQRSLELILRRVTPRNVPPNVSRIRLEQPPCHRRPGRPNRTASPEPPLGELRIGRTIRATATERLPRHHLGRSRRPDSVAPGASPLPRFERCRSEPSSCVRARLGWRRAAGISKRGPRAPTRRSSARRRAESWRVGREHPCKLHVEL